MPRKPQRGDFIPKHLITDKGLLEKIRATARNPSTGYGLWNTTIIEKIDGLYFDKDGDWVWAKEPHHNRHITPEDLLGPGTDWLKPGMWVKVKTVNGLKKRWYVGKNSYGASVIEIPEHTDYTEVGTQLIHPIPDPVQAACNKLEAESGYDITPQDERTLRMLNDLGLLKE